MNHLSIELRLKLSSALHISGDRVLMGVDKACALSANGEVILPASTVKGLLRSSAEALLAAWGKPVCQAHNPADICQGSKSCLVCQAFGNPQKPAVLRFTDARPSQRPPTQARSGVSISRQRRAALPQRLFYLETASPIENEWVAQAEGYFPNQPSAQQAAALVWLAARFSPIVGGGRSRGLGWIEAWTVQSRLDGSILPPEVIQSFAVDWAGAAQP